MIKFRDFKMIIILSVYTFFNIYINFNICHKLNLKDIYKEIDFLYEFYNNIKIIVYITLPLINCITYNFIIYKTYKNNYLDLDKKYNYSLIFIPIVIYILMFSNYCIISRVIVGIIMIDMTIINSIMLLIFKRKEMLND